MGVAERAPPSISTVGVAAIASEKVAVIVTESEAFKMLSASVSVNTTVGGFVSVTKVKLVVLDNGRLSVSVAATVML